MVKQDEKHTEIIAVQIVTDAEAFIEYSEKNNVNNNSRTC